MNSRTTPPAGWSFEVEEISAGVYQVTGRDAVGHSVVATGTDPDALLAECEAMASRSSRPVGAVSAEGMKFSEQCAE